MKPGERRIKGLLISRIVVFIAIFAIPIVLFILFNFSGFEFTVVWLPEPYKSVVLISAPYFFSIGWLFILILFANRISGSLDNIDLNSQVIPQRLKIFYGFNAIVVMIIFGFPLLTPVICVISFASFGYRISTFKKDWEEGELIPKYAKYTSFAFAIFPAIISLFVLPDMLYFSQYIWVNLWAPRLQALHNFSMALCTALTFGSLFIMIKTGASEYEKDKLLKNQDLNFTWVYIVEIVLFGLFIFLQYLENKAPIQAFYIIGFIVACFVTLINLLRNRKQVDFSKYFFGYVMTIVLLGFNALTWDQITTETIKNVSIIASAIIYIIVYFIVFLRYDEDI